MSSAIQERADAAIDSYANRSQSDVYKKKEVHLDGKLYQIFGYANDPVSGFHATAYQDPKTFNIIIAYRGTDPALFSGTTAAERRGHVLTIVQDITVDATGCGTSLTCSSLHPFKVWSLRASRGGSLRGQQGHLRSTR
jgi:hypothetical protein